jgi:hypothetical protein
LRTAETQTDRQTTRSGFRKNGKKQHFSVLFFFPFFYFPWQRQAAWLCVQHSYYYIIAGLAVSNDYPYGCGVEPVEEKKRPHRRRNALEYRQSESITRALHHTHPLKQNCKIQPKCSNVLSQYVYDCETTSPPCAAAARGSSSKSRASNAAHTCPRRNGKKQEQTAECTA